MHGRVVARAYAGTRRVRPETARVRGAQRARQHAVAPRGNTFFRVLACVFRVSFFQGVSRRCARLRRTSRRRVSVERLELERAARTKAAPSEKASRGARPREISPKTLGRLARRVRPIGGGGDLGERRRDPPTESHGDARPRDADEEAISTEAISVKCACRDRSSVGHREGARTPARVARAKRGVGVFLLFRLRGSRDGGDQDPPAAPLDFFHRPPQPAVRVCKPDSGDDSTIPGSTR